MKKAWERKLHKSNKSNRKRAMALFLTAGLTMGVIGCGTEENGSIEGSTDKGKAGTQTEAQAQTPTEVEGNYYKGTYETIPEENSIGKVAVAGTAVYYLIWDEADAYRVKLKKYDTESKNVTEVSLPLGEGESVEALAVNSQGNLVVLKTDWSQSGGAMGQVPYWVAVYRTDGSVIMEKEVTQLLDGSDIPYLYYLAVGADDRIAFTNLREVWVMDKEGNIEFSVQAEGNTIQDLGTLPGGKIAAAQYEGETATVIKVLDLEKKAWGETFKSDRFNDNVCFTENTESGIYFWNYSELYRYDPESGNTEVVANWLANDIFADDIQYVSVAEDGSICIISGDSTGNGGGNELAYLQQIDAKKAGEKQVITLGTIEVNSGIRKGVISFNKASEKYRVEIIEYGNNSNAEDGATRFKNEMIAGNMPDVVNITDGTEEFYAAKGLLEDLKPYMDGGQGINRADYFENILTAMETDGKLYALSPEFYIDTMVGKTENVGEGYNWTMEDMMKLEETRGEGVEMFDHETKSGILDYYLRYNLAQFFDLNKGFCDFNTEEFKKVLEFCNRFPKENEYQDTDASEWRKASDGTLLLMREGIMGVQDYQMCHNIFGTDISFVGYPSSFSCGSVAKGGDMTLAMNSKCADKEGAWEFIRYFLEEEYQTRYTVYLPLLRSAFDAGAKEAMQAQYETNEAGEQVEVSNMMIGTRDFTLEVYAAKEEEVAAIKTLIEKIERMERIDDQVLSIVLEEAGAYFDGQKTVDDVVQVIQSRADIYMNENK